MERYQKELTRIKEHLKDKHRGMTVTEIAKAININRNSVAKYLDVLLISGHVEMKSFGPAKVYFLSHRVPISALLNFSSDYIIVTDQNLQIIQANDNFKQFMQLENDMIIGQPINKTMRPLFADQPEINERIKGALEGKDSTMELEIIRDEFTLYFRMKILPTTFDDGNPGVTLLLENITDAKHSEIKLTWESSVNAALAELSRVLIQQTSIESISDMVLEYAQRLTESKFGFVGYIDQQTGYLITPTLTKDIWETCQVPDKVSIFKKFHGLWGWVLENKQPILTNTPSEDLRSSGIPKGHIPITRFLSVPAIVGEKLMGQVAVSNSKREYSEQDLKLIEQMASLYALAIQRKHAETELLNQKHDLNERVKELNCLYSISKILEQSDTTLETILQKIINLIPPAWQFPEITCARLKIEDKEFRTNSFSETSWKQDADILMNEKNIGQIEVYYLEKRPKSDDGPFLHEERNLLNVIAERIGTIIARKRAEEQVRQ